MGLLTDREIRKSSVIENFNTGAAINTVVDFLVDAFGYSATDLCYIHNNIPDTSDPVPVENVNDSSAKGRKLIISSETLEKKELALIFRTIPGSGYFAIDFNINNERKTTTLWYHGQITAFKSKDDLFEVFIFYHNNNLSNVTAQPTVSSFIVKKNKTGVKEYILFGGNCFNKDGIDNGSYPAPDNNCYGFLSTEKLNDLFEGGNGGVRVSAGGLYKILAVYSFVSSSNVNFFLPFVAPDDLNGKIRQIDGLYILIGYISDADPNIWCKLQSLHITSFTNSEEQFIVFPFYRYVDQNNSQAIITAVPI